MIVVGWGGEIGSLDVDGLRIGRANKAQNLFKLLIMNGLFIFCAGFRCLRRTNLRQIDTLEARQIVAVGALGWQVTTLVTIQP
jgi:purine nucleoside phosphorylase